MINSKYLQLLRRSGGVPWYLAGGVPLANVLGAWQPKFASSYAASKISLVNPSASNLLVDGAAFPAWAAATGWTFAAASSQYLTIASAIATATPLTMVCRFNPVSSIVSYSFMSICDTAANNLYQLYCNVTAKVISQSINLATIAEAIETTAFSAGNWFTGTAVFTTATNRNIYLDGAGKGTDITNCAPAGLDTTYIGTRYYAGTLGGWMNGSISACAILKIALSDAQVLAQHNALVAAGL